MTPRPRLAAAFPLVALVALVLLPELALAQSTTSSTSTSAMSQEIINAANSTPLNQWLQQIYGQLAGGSATVLGTAMGYFNAGVMAIASMYVFYNMTASVAQSAHEGEILGKRWSTLWAPIRLLSGSVGLMPVGGGFTVVQALMLHAALIGSGFGDVLWSKSVDAMLNQQVPLIQPQMEAPYNLAKGLLDSYVCVYTLNYIAQYEQNATLPYPSNAAQSGTITRTADQSWFSSSMTPVQVITWQPAANSGFDNSTCGSVSTAWALSYDEESDLSTAVMQAHQSALSTLMTQMDSLAQQIVAAAYPATDQTQSMPDPRSQTVKTDVGQYANSVNSAIQQVVSSNASSLSSARQTLLQDAIQKGGWVEAGSWYIFLVRLNEQLLKLSTFIPKTTAPTYVGAEGWLTSGTVKTVQAAADNWWAMAALRGASDVYNNPLKTTTSGGGLAGVTAASKIRGNVDDAIGDTASGGMDGLLKFLDPANDDKARANPVQFIIGLGEKLKDLALIMYGAKAGTMVASMAMGPEAGAVVAAINGVIGPLLNSIALVTLIAGCTLSYVFPMQPYIIFTVAAFGYLVLIAEGILAAPLWAFAHLRMEGEGLAGEHGGKGYLLMLSLLFRPALMILGLLLGMSMITVAMEIVHDTFTAAMRSAFGGGHAYLGIIAMAIMLVVLVVIMAERCFQLIHVIPDRVLAIVSSNNNLGDEQHSDRARAMVTGGTQHLLQSVDSGIQRASLDPKNAKFLGGMLRQFGQRQTLGATSEGGIRGMTTGQLDATENAQSGQNPAQPTPHQPNPVAQHPAKLPVGE